MNIKLSLVISIEYKYISNQQQYSIYFEGS